jgi:hypothetical protein
MQPVSPPGFSREAVYGPAGPRCVDIFGDPQAEILVDENNWIDAENGTLSVTDQTTGTIEVTATRPGPFSGTISYTVTDADGESDTGLITVSIKELPDPIAVGDLREQLPRQTFIVANNADCTNTDPQVTISLNVLGNDEVDPLAEPLAVDTFTNPNPAGGVLTRIGNDLQYTPDINFDGDSVSFTYTVIDGLGRTSNLEGPATVELRMQTPLSFAAASDAFARSGCFGCHSTNSADGDWTNYGAVESRANNTPRELCGSSERNILNPPDDGRSAHAAWVPTDPDFQVVWRWIEQGKAR